LYITGYTCSDDFPLLNPYDDSSGIDFLEGEAFITKFSNNGSLLWSTYLGGNNYDCGWSIASDEEGNFFVTGYTCSDDFPVLKAYDDTHDGWSNVFVAKFSSKETLLWSTYFGGGGDEANAITVDNDGNVYVTGYTCSDEFPVLNAYKDKYQGETDAFIIKLSSKGSLLWSTYLGSKKTDCGLGICINANGNLYITGYTSAEGFLQLNNGLNETFGGIARHVFVFSINLADIPKFGFFNLQYLCIVSLFVVLTVLVILKKKQKI
ncbi:MAG: SBBP repeat-containing protein, partial [Candidatus Heimdallarchaeaceae archaeon]